MTDIYADTRQRGSVVEGALWFEFPENLQETVNHWVVMLAESPEGGDVAEIASNMADDDESSYSDTMWVRVGSRRYYIYRRCGLYRMGCGGRDGTQEPYGTDRTLLIEFFMEQKI
jgi:hypothetical protein